MARRTLEQIVELVKQHEDQTRTRRTRMDADHSMWRLEELPANASVAPEKPGIGEGWRHYTSNEPRTFANKAVSIASTAKVIIRVKGGAIDPKKKRDKQNDKERFLIGAFAAADERLTEILQRPLQEQLSWYSLLRGWVAARTLLRKRADGSTFVDIQPFDPRNTYWGIGPDGPDWACVMTRRTPRDIKSVYGKEVSGIDSGEEEGTGVPVYDFYDMEENRVMTVDTILKRAQKHGSPRVPVWIGVVGETPQIYDGTGSAGADYGDSLYAADRDIYPHHNFMMSIVLELMGRARSTGYVLTSPDGTKTLSADPFKAGSEIALRSGETIEPLAQIETTRDAAGFAAIISGEMQRGALPQSAFGELPFQLSGFAINSLRQGIGTVIAPTIKAMEAAYTGIANLLVDQYIAGGFKAMEVAGLDRNREYFSEEITPEQVESAGGRIVIEIVPELPQDEPAKMQMAHMARDGGSSGIPLFGDRTIKEDWLNRQDPDADEAILMEQMASRATPMAQAKAMLDAAVQLGREDLAQIWMGEMMRIMRDTLLMDAAKAQAAGGQQGPQPGGGPGGVPGIPAGIMPSQATGTPQVAPTPQQGPLVPQGTPRPGAQNGAATADEILLG